jgi:hypothetical protein
VRRVDHSDDALAAVGSPGVFGRFTSATPLGRQDALAMDDKA